MSATRNEPGAGSAWGSAARLAVGTLTVLRVRPPARVDRLVAQRAMLLAPVVGLGLGLIAAAVLFLAREWCHQPWVPAALAVAALALLTGGLHLDGLADTADGLAVARTRGRVAGLAVMRQGTVGPMGVAGVVLVVVVQSLALAGSVYGGVGTEAVVAAALAGRIGLVVACSRGIPSARPEGLGATVAGTVPVWGAVAWVVAGAAVAAAYGGWLDDDAGMRPALLGAGAVLLAAAATLVVVRLAVRRLGGITGDVLGAVVELATLTALLVTTYHHR